MPCAELLGRLGEALRHRIAHPGGHVGARAWQHADDDADNVAAHLRGHVLLRQRQLAREDAAEAPEGQLGRLGREHRAHDLRYGEDADQGRDGLDAAQKIGEPEGEARCTGRVFDANATDEQADQHARDRLHRRGARHHGRAHQAEEREPEILERRELQRHLGKWRRQRHQRERAGDAA